MIPAWSNDTPQTRQNLPEFESKTPPTFEIRTRHNGAEQLHFEAPTNVVSGGYPQPSPRNHVAQREIQIKALPNN